MVSTYTATRWTSTLAYIERPRFGGEIAGNLLLLFVERCEMHCHGHYYLQASVDPRLDLVRHVERKPVGCADALAVNVVLRRAPYEDVDARVQRVNYWDG